VLHHIAVVEDSGSKRKRKKNVKERENMRDKVKSMRDVDGGDK